MTDSKKKIVVIAGPTASGKSALAIRLAEIFNAEIVNADSMQVYRFMDIGTAKPSPEDRLQIRHHVIDIIEPDEDYSAAQYKLDAGRAIDDIFKRGKHIFVVGGTGLYIRALTKGLFKGPGRNELLRKRLENLSEKNGGGYLYKILKRVDPASCLKIHPNNEKRIVRALEVSLSADKPISLLQMEHGFRESPYETLYIGLAKDRVRLYQDIEARVDSMMEAGFTDEVKRLIGMGFTPALKSMQSLGYKEAALYLDGKICFDDMIREIKKNTKRYAKRQFTWFNKEPDIIWLSAEDEKQVLSKIKSFLEG